MSLDKINNKLKVKFNESVYCEEINNTRFVRGKVDKYDDALNACFLCVSKDPKVHVVNELEIEELKDKKEDIYVPNIKDKSLDKRHCDALVIGGGISGCSILRELSRYNLDLLLVDKEADLANQTSSRNDGEVHPGVDLNKGSLKQRYVVKGNRMFDQITKELDVPFKRVGQIAGFTQWYLRPIIEAFCLQRKLVCGVDDTKVVGSRFIKKNYPELNPKFKFGIYNPMAGVTSPYELTIAYGENAIENGAHISLDTIVLSMEVENGVIKSVLTNKGTIYPRIVINAAGVFAEEISKMANDHFYSIHPRKGTIIITDKKANHFTSTISSIKELKAHDATHSKGGGSMRTIHNNLLLGPDAKEIYLKEDLSTDSISIDKIITKQSDTIPGISKRDIITYFSGIRAANFEEDFVIEYGRNTHNLIHVACIQSPGLTTAPAVAIDVSKMAVELLRKEMDVSVKLDFNPYRKKYPVLNELDLDKRNELIKQNKDYGIIICRCEEISKGEIIDCLNRPLKVVTIDAIKRRIRPGMGRCQGGFCMPFVAQIIAEHEGIPLKDVRKNSNISNIGIRNKGE